jgi:uncharacterized membrane protein YwzB
MKLNVFMAITALIAFVFGVAFLVAPAWSLQVYGVNADVNTQFLGRYFGAALIGIAFLAWLARNTPASGARQAVLISLFVSNMLGFVVSVYDKFAGFTNQFVWMNVGIYLILALGFGYYSFIKAD